MSTIQKVVLLGASGALGSALLPALLAANFEVTAVTRPSSSKTFPAGVKVAKVELTDEAGLTQLFRGQDAVIAALGWEATASQKVFVDAAVAAGVKRILPAEFGGDLQNEKVASLAMFQGKAQLENYIAEKTEGTRTSYTFVYNGAFLDWGVANQFLLDLQGRSITLFDGGDIPFTVAPLDMIARGTAAALNKADETRNRAIRIHGASVSQKQILALTKKVVGEEGWTENQVSTEGVENMTQEDLGKGMFNIILGLFKSIVGTGYHGDFSDDNDNALLGLKVLSEAEIEDYIRKVAESKK